MSKKHLFLSSACLAVFSAYVSAQSLTVSGTIRDALTGESIIGATCVDEGSGIGAVSNEAGFFSIKTSEGARLTVGCLSYATKTVEAKAGANMDIRLSPSEHSIDEVSVSAVVPAREQTMMDMQTMSVAYIKSLPSFVGEPDIVKTATQMAGISQGKDGYSDIFVRGADRGQNLIMLDGIKIYNSNHLGGLVSLVNADIVKHVDIYKGGFPARYGGRASSIIDIRSKDGAKDRTHAVASVGTLTSRANVNGPIGDRLTYNVGARISYEGIAKRGDKKAFEKEEVIRVTADNEFYMQTFADLNARFRLDMSDNASLALTLFHSIDKTEVGSADGSYGNTDSQGNILGERSPERTSQKIRNNGASLSLLVGKDETTWRTWVSASRFANTLDRKTTYVETKKVAAIETTEGESQIGDISAGTYVDVLAKRNKLTAGLEVARYSFMPGKESTTYDDLVDGTSTSYLLEDFEEETSVEASFHVSDEVTLWSPTRLNIGLRATIYSCDGKRYRGLEPRIAFRQMLNDNASIKASFTTMEQFNHVLVNNDEVNEIEVWLGANKELSPQKAHQVALGYFFGSDEKGLNISVELFHKQMRDLIDYKSANTDQHGAIGSILRNITTGGKGRASGLEIQASKNIRKTSINASYTLSHSERQFDDVNGGHWYDHTYDRRHDFSVAVVQKIGQRWSAAANFLFMSGMAATFPVGIVPATPISKADYEVYAERNNGRLPAYHRLDLSLSRSHIARRGAQHVWNINVYNAYAHKNALGYMMEGGQLYAYSYFSIVPSVSYTFTF